jgi:predicted glycosyltransferase
MTREMAVLGIPTISVYQDTLLDVDQYLIDKGMMVHIPGLTGELAYEYMQKSEQREPNRDLLLRGQETYLLIKDLIINKLSDKIK